MNRQHIYRLTVEWTGNTGNGTQNYYSYKRNHTVQIPNKVDIHCSSDAAFRGDKTKHNPEELFLASIATCHMLWYLHLCTDAGIIVVDYKDNATGIMQETENGGGHFTEVTLHPVVIIGEHAMISKADELHKKANELCFIANSCNFPIYHNPTCKTSNA
ncbi:OsmC family protein [Parapedobacter tibetensis]|uniref:OsmC family protein n=1 Tax=Parapedobacter tibetensis TaxID=2972951 RepID=UPI00214D6532|nr:OsmC family protein [Parapedobacter tibetensis]